MKVTAMRSQEVKRGFVSFRLITSYRIILCRIVSFYATTLCVLEHVAIYVPTGTGFGPGLSRGMLRAGETG